MTTFPGLWFQEMFYKCSGMQIPHDKRIEIFGVALSNIVYQNRYESFDIFALLHYPNQLLRSLRSVKLSWPRGKPNATLDIRFIVNGVEVIRRRNKGNQPCDDGWRNHDDNIVSTHIDKVGCRAPYQYPKNMVRKCSSMILL